MKTKTILLGLAGVGGYLAYKKGIFGKSTEKIVQAKADAVQKVEQVKADQIKEEVKAAEVEVSKPVAPPKITTTADLQDLIDKKRQVTLQTAEVKTIESITKNDQELIDKLMAKYREVDQSTDSGKALAIHILDLVKQAEARKVAAATSTSNIINMGLGLSGYQQLLPVANWTLNDVLRKDVRIVMEDLLKPSTREWHYEYNPIDANVEFKKQGNWASVYDDGTRNAGKVLTVLSPSTVQAVLETRARDPRRYRVTLYTK